MEDPIFQSLCSTSTWNALGLMCNTSNSYLFMCFRASCSTQRFQLMFSRDSCSKQTSNTHVLQSLSLNTNIKYSCAPDLLTQHKHQILMCLRARAQHKYLINYVLQGPRPTHETIYIKNMYLDYTQYIKQIIILMCIGVLCPIYKIKHHNNITWNVTYAHKFQVKNSGYYTTLPQILYFRSW